MAPGEESGGGEAHRDKRARSGAEAGTAAGSDAAAAKAAAVAQHYSARQDVGRAQRQESFIIGLRLLNNWVKASRSTTVPLRLGPSILHRGP